MQNSPWKSWLIKLLGSCMLLGGLLYFVPMDDIWHGLRQVPLWLFPTVLFLFVVGHIAAAAKWWNLMRRGLPLSVAIRAHFAGLAANLCLPTIAGGDALRAALAYKAMPDMGRIASAATADRLIDLIALACIATTGAVLSGSNVGSAAVALTVILLISLGIMFGLPQLLQWISTRYPRFPMQTSANRLKNALFEIKRSPSLVITTFIVSVAIQIVFIALALWLASSMGLSLGFAVWAFAWSMAKIISILPLSINGLGLREASLATLLLPFGAQPALVVAAGLAWQAVLFAAGALGAMFFSLSTNNTSDATAAQTRKV